MNELITIVVPSCPSGFRPYPELTIEATVEEFRIIATCLRAMEKTANQFVLGWAQWSNMDMKTSYMIAPKQMNRYTKRSPKHWSHIGT